MCGTPHVSHRISVVGFHAGRHEAAATNTTIGRSWPDKDRQLDDCRLQRSDFRLDCFRSSGVRLPLYASIATRGPGWLVTGEDGALNSGGFPLPYSRASPECANESATGNSCRHRPLPVKSSEQ
jgi:hypothetical protein